MLYVGIDVSKLSFDAAVLIDNKYKNQKFDNNTKGFKSLYKWLLRFNEQKVFCMEATGIYSLALAKYIYHSGNSVVVANAQQVSDFAKMRMLKNKTDKADAKLIASYIYYLASNNQLDKYCFVPSNESLAQLRSLIVRLEQLNKSLTIENNHLGGKC